jgi:aminoglycoside phosphotransferase
MEETLARDNALMQSVVEKYKLSHAGSIKRFNSGQINRVYEIGDRYVMKIKGKRVQELALFDWQVSITGQLLAAGVKVPRVLGSEILDGEEYLLMEKIPGRILSQDWLTLDKATKENLISQLAEQLRLFHSIAKEKYMAPIVTGTPYDTFLPAVEKLTSFTNFDRSKLATKYRDDLEHLESFFLKHKDLLEERGTAVPVHHDVNLENILWECGGLTGIIDLDWMCYSPRDYELKRIVHYAHTPKYGVSEDLEVRYEHKNLEQEVKWLQKYYPELFASEHLVERVRLYLVDELLHTVRGYTGGDWSEDVIQEWHQLVQDYYINDWLPNLLKK